LLPPHRHPNSDVAAALATEGIEFHLSARWRRFWLTAGLAVVASTVFFHRAVFSVGIFTARDMLRVYYPLRQYWAERVSHLEFPFWYPYDGMGQSFLGMTISGALHPTNLLYLALPIALAIKVNVLLCYPAAFAGVYRLLRRFGLSHAASTLGGLLFAFNGYMVTISSNLLYLMAAASFPWAFWGADRFFTRPSPGAALGAALLLASVLFCGDPQSFAVCGAAVGILAAIRHQPGKIRSTLGTLAALWALTGLLAAVQILPSLSAMSPGQAGHQSLDTALVWSMHPFRLAELLFGPIFAQGSQGAAATLLKTSQTTLWADSIHVGLVAVALAGIALAHHRRSRLAVLLFAAAAAVLVLMLGKHAGVYALIFRALPLWRPFRFPEKLTPYLMMPVACGAAVGLEIVRRHRRRGHTLLFGALCLASAVALLLELRSGVFSRWFFPTDALGAESAAAAQQFHHHLITACAQTASALLLSLGVIAGAGNDELRAWLLCLLVFSHLYVANESLYSLSSPEVLSPNAFVTEIKTREGPPALGGFRVASGTADYHPPPLPGLSAEDASAISTSTVFASDTQALWNLESINVYLPAFSNRIYDLLQHGPVWYRRYMRLFSAKYLSIPADLYQKLGGPEDRIVARQRQLGLLLVENPNVRPRAYLARPRCASREDSLRLMRSPGFAWDREAIVECKEPPAPTPEEAQLGSVKILSYRPERVELQAQVTTPSVLVLTDSYDPGWSARVDGTKADVLPTNYAVRGLSLTAGTHSILYEYHCPGFVSGLLLALFALVACAGVVGWRTRMKHVGSRTHQAV
jgi:hypothetical protein